MILPALFVCSALALSSQSSQSSCAVRLYARARVTCYTVASSCHNKNKRGECLTASGKVVRDGMAACPRSIPFGMIVHIGKKESTCEDRYARWLDAKYPETPTVDVFTSGTCAGASIMPIYFSTPIQK